MFMAGTALAYSLHRQQQQGMAWSDSFKKALSGQHGSSSGASWTMLSQRRIGIELWDVLTQLSFTTLVAFFNFQMVDVGTTWCQFRIVVAHGDTLSLHQRAQFDQPFTDQHNFGNYVDLL